MVPAYARGRARRRRGSAKLHVRASALLVPRAIFMILMWIQIEYARRVPLQCTVAAQLARALAAGYGCNKRFLTWVSISSSSNMPLEYFSRKRLLQKSFTYKTWTGFLHNLFSGGGWARPTIRLYSSPLRVSSFSAGRFEHALFDRNHSQAETLGAQVDSNSRSFIAAWHWSIDVAALLSASSFSNI